MDARRVIVERLDRLCNAAVAGHPDLLDGWRHRCTLLPEQGFECLWSHPFSPGLAFGWPVDDVTDDAIASRLEASFIQSDEVAAIHSLPELGRVHVEGDERRSFSTELRLLARAWGWTETEVSGTARLAQEFGLLSEAEAEWLERFGPSDDARAEPPT